MISKKVRNTFTGIFVIFVLIGALVLGLMMGYKVVMNQKARYDAMQRISNQQDLIRSEVEGKYAKELAAKSTEAQNNEESNGAAANLQAERTKYEMRKNALAEWKAQNNITLDYTVPDSLDEHLLPIFINFGDSTKQIAEKLEKQGLISSKTVFTLLSKINGFDGNYQYGTHYLREGMRYDELMYTLTLKPRTALVVIPEGSTYIDIKNILRKANISFDEKKLDTLMNSPDVFAEYKFLSAIKPQEGRNYLLDGYLFPDSYYFDYNASEESILRTLLNNTRFKLLEQYYERAKALNKSMDQIITLASVIQKESSYSREMYKISRVFVNREAQGMKMESCATINYLRQQEGLEPIFIVGEADLNRESKYNTYKFDGLPPGPICNPGIEAISAALYPDTSDESLSYMFFCADGKGRNVFADNFEQHQANIAKYLTPLQQGN